MCGQERRNPIYRVVICPCCLCGLSPDRRPLPSSARWHAAFGPAGHLPHASESCRFPQPQGSVAVAQCQCCLVREEGVAAEIGMEEGGRL